MKHLAWQHPKLRKSSYLNISQPFFRNPILSKSLYLDKKKKKFAPLRFSFVLPLVVSLFLFPTLPITTFLPSALPNSSHVPSSLRGVCGRLEWFWWLGTGCRYLRGFAHSMGVQHSHRSGLQNCCKARCQTFDCHAVALVRHGRPHTARAESVTLLLTSLFQIRAKKAGWLTCSSASA